MSYRGWFLIGFAVCLSLLPVQAQQLSRKTRNIILVTTDGMRWQDVFRGADPSLLDKEHGGVAELEGIKKEFWRESVHVRRQVLMPFLWSAFQQQGQLYGNRDLGSEAAVTNGRNFSYPGYSELLTGFPDPRIDSNDKKDNPNITVLEWLNQKAPYRGQIAAFGAWDVFPFILNTTRSGLPVNAGYTPFAAKTPSPQMDLLNRLKVETGIWDGEALDAPMFLTALEHLRSAKPRVLYVALGDTDEWAHAGRYDLYLKAAHRVDQYVRELWEAAQTIPEYRDSTTLILAVDHGRGSSADTWRSHGEKVPESKYVWLGILGPDTPALGERTNISPITESQVATTLAALLGEEYTRFSAKAGAALPDAIRH